MLQHAVETRETTPAPREVVDTNPNTVETNRIRAERRENAPTYLESLQDLWFVLRDKRKATPRDHAIFCWTLATFTTLTVAGTILAVRPQISTHDQESARWQYSKATEDDLRTIQINKNNTLCVYNTNSDDDTYLNVKERLPSDTTLTDVIIFEEDPRYWYTKTFDCFFPKRNAQVIPTPR